MEDCLFCKIIAKHIPSVPVYEDENVYAFLDINPVNPGHTLVVPKKHSAGLHDAEGETLYHLVDALQTIAKAVMVGLGTEGFNIEENNGEIAGQVIPHLHFHIVPRRVDDGLKHWPGTPYAEGRAEEVAERIRGAM